MTINHQEIKDWAKSIGAKPGIVDHPKAPNDKVGIRLNFPGFIDEAVLSGSNPRGSITWDKFFTIFEESDLAFVYDSAKPGDDPTLWYWFERREHAIPDQ